MNAFLLPLLNYTGVWKKKKRTPGFTEAVVSQEDLIAFIEHAFMYYLYIFYAASPHSLFKVAYEVKHDKTLNST